MKYQGKRRCHNCKFCYTQDEGYSNYTVEETVYHCLKNLNPTLPESGGYSWANEDHEVMKVAETCEGYSHGDMLAIDVDHEDAGYHFDDYPEGKCLADFYSNDPEVIEAYKKYQE